VRRLAVGREWHPNPPIEGLTLIEPSDLPNAVDAAEAAETADAVDATDAADADGTAEALAESPADTPAAGPPSEQRDSSPAGPTDTPPSPRPQTQGQAEKADRDEDLLTQQEISALLEPPS